MYSRTGVVISAGSLQGRRSPKRAVVVDWYNKLQQTIDCVVTTGRQIKTRGKRTTTQVTRG